MYQYFTYTHVERPNINTLSEYILKHIHKVLKVPMSENVTFLNQRDSSVDKVTMH